MTTKITAVCAQVDLVCVCNAVSGEEKRLYLTSNADGQVDIKLFYNGLFIGTIVRLAKNAVFEFSLCQFFNDLAGFERSYEPQVSQLLQKITREPNSLNSMEMHIWHNRQQKGVVKMDAQTFSFALVKELTTPPTFYALLLEELNNHGISEKQLNELAASYDRSGPMSAMARDIARRIQEGITLR
jgi:hypothetical protein